MFDSNILLTKFGPGFWFRVSGVGPGLIVDQRINFYSQNTNLLPPKPKSTFRHLKQGIQDFHRKYVLVPADKAANNVVVV